MELDKRLRPRQRGKVVRSLHKAWTKSKLAARMLRLYRNWPSAMFALLYQRERHPFVVRFRRGVELSVHTRSLDVNILDEVWTDNVYTPPKFTIRDGWVVVDIGGHKGIFSTFAATAAKEVTVHTFEASPDNFAVLAQNIRRNHLSNVNISNIAIGARDGESVLHLYGDHGQNSLLQRSNPQMRPVREIKVETWSLQHVLRKVNSTVNLLKMDIEGMEYEAFFACPEEDLHRIERIALEYHDDIIQTPCSVFDLVEFLQAKGFATELIQGREILLAERVSKKDAAELQPEAA